MNHELLNSRDAVRKQDRTIKQVTWRNYQNACERRWGHTHRYLPVENYKNVLSLCWKERLPANKAVEVIRFIESEWDNEDEVCPQMAYDFVKENKTALNRRGWKKTMNGVQR